MKLVTINRNPSPRDLRLFSGLWFPAACVLIGLAVQRGTGSWTAALVIWCTGAVLSALGLLFPRAGRLLYLFWIYLTFPIGLVVSYTLFTAAYFGILTPAGLLMRILGYDPLRLRRKHRDADSDWTARPPPADRSRYFNQY
jgi:hypothetical protein